MTKTLEDHLKNIYFDPENVAFFTSPQKLWTIVKSHGFSPTLAFIKQWINDQQAASLHKPALRKFKRLRFVVTGLDKNWHMDLLDMSNYAEANQGYRYLLMVCDVYSRYLFVRPVKTKQGAEIKNAFEDIMTKSKRKCSVITSDAGGEFVNRVTKSFFKKHDIYHQVTNNDPKAAIIERINKIFKLKVVKYMTHYNTHNYLQVLQKLVATYNKTKHGVTKIAPAKVTPALSKKLWWSIYRPKTLEKPIPFKFRVGDTVRLSHLNHAFKREYDEKWTGEPFKIASRSRRLGIPFYRVKDLNDKLLTGFFYNAELSKINLHKDHVWQIEKILRRRTKQGVKQALIRWKYFSSDFDTWVNADEIQAFTKH